MADPQPDSESEAVRLMLKVFAERAAEAVRHEEEVDYQAQREMEKTARITRLALYVSFFITPLIFFLIGSLVLDMGYITARMGEMAVDVGLMRDDFDQVALLIESMDSSVAGITTNIEVMPPMADRLAEIHGNFSAILGSMNGITPDVGQIDQFLVSMDYDMAQMNRVFDHLNMNVFQMGRDVNTLSSPMRMMPFFGR